MLVVKQQPQLPSQRLGKHVSSDLEGVLMRLLAKQPQERFLSADELAEALRNCSAFSSWSNADAETWWKSRTDRDFMRSSMPTPGVGASVGTVVWTSPPQ
jgi:hypothetical protein